MARWKQDELKPELSIGQQAVAQLQDAEASDYGVLLEDIKQRIREAQVRAALAVNRELVLLYWQIGREIRLRQVQEGWGAKVIARLAKDLQSAFPEMSGLSPRNLRYMNTLYGSHPEEEIVQQLVAQIPWGHNTVLLDKVGTQDERLWYAQKTIENGWSRSVLVHQIESDLYRRQGGAITNFHATLPAPQSDLAHQLLKDPYTFDFLTLGQAVQERELEQGLIDHIQTFLLELGMGFAFVGRQYHLEAGGEDFYLDLIFYHLHLRCYVVIDLKVEKFKPEFAGKMNFYLAAVDDLLRHPEDGPSIGLIICKEKNRVIVEYSLRDMDKPMGAAEYVLTKQLPEAFSGELPTTNDVVATIQSGKLSVTGGRIEARVIPSSHQLTEPDQSATPSPSEELLE